MTKSTTDIGVQQAANMEDEEENISEGSELSEEEEDGFDGLKHAAMLRGLSAMDGEAPKYKSTAERHELAAMSEFHTPASRDSVHLHQLVSALDEKSSSKELKVQIKKMKGEEKALPKPLSKVEQERLHRTLAYSNASDQLDKWQPIVMSNRSSETLSFPLPKKDVKMITTVQALKKIKPKTELEQEVAKIINSNDTTIDSKYFLTNAEKKAVQAMSVEEAKERRAELQKYRALLSYQEAKARRTKKIKSKSYHRLLRREALKKEKQTLEELEKTDPEAYAEKLHNLDLDRMKERHTLKHRGGSKFAKKQVIYKKYDERARAEIQEMLQKSRELTKKVALEEESSEGEASEGEDSPDNASKTLTSKNPWMTAGIKISKQLIKSGAIRLQPVTNIVQPSSDQETEAEETMEITNLEQTANELIKFDDKTQKGTRLTKETDVVEGKTLREMKGSFVETGKKRNKQKKSAKRKAEDKLEILKQEQKKKRFEDKSGNQSKEENEKKNKSGTPNVTSTKVVSKALVNEAQLEESHNKGTNADEKIDELFNVLDDKEKHDINSRKTQKRKAKNESSTKMKKSRNLREESKECEEEQAEEEKKKRRQALTDEILVKNSSSSGIKVSSKRKRTLQDFDKEDSSSESDDDLEAQTHSELTNSQSEASQKNTPKPIAKKCDENKDKVLSVDPNKFITLSGNSKKITLAEEESEEEGQSLTIAQAFAADDVVDEFSQEKRGIIQRDKPKDLNLTLPGWGDWGGEGLRGSKRKKKRFTIKAAPAQPRQDRKLNNVIISEVKDKTIAKHQVSSLPFKFSNPDQFESSIRQPIGNTWNPETAFRKLIQPKKRTGIGHIIEPMTNNSLTRKGAADRKAKRTENRELALADLERRKDERRMSK